MASDRDYDSGFDFLLAAPGRYLSVDEYGTYYINDVWWKGAPHPEIVSRLEHGYDSFWDGRMVFDNVR